MIELNDAEHDHVVAGSIPGVERLDERHARGVDAFPDVIGDAAVDRARVVAHVGYGVLDARRVLHVGDEELQDVGHVQLVIVLAEHLPGTGDVERSGELVHGADAAAHKIEENNGSTLPRSVISPVIASLSLTFLWVSAEVRAVSMVIPAEGPSLGTAPSGAWMWMSLFL